MQELAADPLGILRPSTKLQHTLPLASAYAAVADAAAQRGGGGDQTLLEQQRKRMDDQHHEPKCATVSAPDAARARPQVAGFQAVNGQATPATAFGCAPMR